MDSVLGLVLGGSFSCDGEGCPCDDISLHIFLRYWLERSVPRLCSIRAEGCAVMVLCAYSVVFFINYAPIGLANIHWKYYIVYDCELAVIFTVIYFMCVETKSTPLEEIAKFFDVEDALVGGGLEMSKKERKCLMLRAELRSRWSRPRPKCKS